MADTILPLFPLDVPAVAQKRLKPTEAAYLAGLLDGEGYFGLHRVTGSWAARSPGYKHWQYFIALVMTDKPLLEDIIALIPWSKAGVQRGNYNLRGRAKPSYRVVWTGGASAAICRAILSYLRLKKRHATLILMLHDAKAQAGKRWYGPKRGGPRYPAWIDALHAEIYKEFRIMNQRGQDNA